MINTKRCRSKFLSLLNNLYNINDDKYSIKIAQQINSLKQYIKDEYFYDKELPKISHQFIDKINQDLDDIENLYNNFLLSKGYDLPEEVIADKQKIIKKASKLIPEYQMNNKIYKTPPALSDLSSVLEAYYETFGKTDTIKALQCGLDIFCKERKHIFKPQKISLDGKIDNNFINLIDKICNKYSTNVIEKYLVKGLMSNIIFETKDEKNINTNVLLSKINEIKNRRIYE